MKKETLREAGYVSIQKTHDNMYILIDKEGKKEFWFANKNHASYGIKYRNTHLEFAHSA